MFNLILNIAILTIVISRRRVTFIICVGGRSGLILIIFPCPFPTQFGTGHLSKSMIGGDIDIGVFGLDTSVFANIRQSFGCYFININISRPFEPFEDRTDACR